MTTYTTGIPLMRREKLPEATVVIRKEIDNANNDTTFRIKIVAPNGIFDNVAITENLPFVINNAFYGTYVITEYDQNGYELVSIVPNTFVINQYNTDQEVIITNTKDPAVSTKLTINKTISEVVVRYGMLYNWYAAANPLIAESGWHVPTDAEWRALGLSMPSAVLSSDGSALKISWAARHLKSVGNLTDGTGLWTKPVSSANEGIDTYGFAIFPSGVVTSGYIQYGTADYCNYWTKDQNSLIPSDGKYWNFGYNGNYMYQSLYHYMKTYGFNIRLVKDSGSADTYTDYDGNVYTADVMPDGKCWMTQNLITTHYSDGSAIPVLTGAAWTNTVGGARAEYDSSVNEPREEFFINIISSGYSLYGITLYVDEPIVIDFLPYGNYTIEEVANAIYPCALITPSTFTIDAGNPTQVVGVINSPGHLVSGYVYYDNIADTPVEGVTVQIKDIAELIPPAVSPAPVTLKSCVTDSNGYFEMCIPNGNYYLYAEKTDDWSGVDGDDVTQIQRYIAHLTPNTILGNALRVRSADIDNSGLVAANDVTILMQRITDGGIKPVTWLAGDWTFTNPSITVSGADVSQDLTGIVTGDYNASWTP